MGFLRWGKVAWQHVMMTMCLPELHPVTTIVFPLTADEGSGRSSGDNIVVTIWMKNPRRSGEALLITSVS